MGQQLRGGGDFQTRGGVLDAIIKAVPVAEAEGPRSRVVVVEVRLLEGPVKQLHQQQQPGAAVADELQGSERALDQD